MDLQANLYGAHAFTAAALPLHVGDVFEIEGLYRRRAGVLARLLGWFGVTWRSGELARFRVTEVNPAYCEIVAEGAD